ncbi:hypothetical protein MPLB_430040 [Mesorhizobium sp. ORS 3324]|nr:hypothetical protein MPLB_430040 [Mesorhizobium sp. ORS 3324]
MTEAPRRKAEAFDYSQLGLKRADLEIVLKCESKLLTLGLRTTEETFEAGEQLSIAASLIPDRTFGKWATAVTRSSRQQWNCYGSWAAETAGRATNLPRGCPPR